MINFYNQNRDLFDEQKAKKINNHSMVTLFCHLKRKHVDNRSDSDKNCFELMSSNEISPIIKWLPLFYYRINNFSIKNSEWKANTKPTLDLSTQLIIAIFYFHFKYFKEEIISLCFGKHFFYCSFKFRGLTS